MSTLPVTTCDTNTNAAIRRLPNGCKSLLAISLTESLNFDSSVFYDIFSEQQDFIALITMLLDDRNISVTSI